MMKFAHLRLDYNKDFLLEKDIPENPFELFHFWFQAALMANQAEANAMVLSTLGLDGFPNSRVVLLKEVDHGFVWFTNYESEKGRELANQPKASLNFFWPQLERQVRLKGMVEKVSDSESNTYFFQRPIGSQVGAMVSQQSQEIQGRESLDKAYEFELKKAEINPIQRPENWGGYRLLPIYFEFWQGRSNRLHDRLYYRLGENGNWKTGRLSP